MGRKQKALLHLMGLSIMVFFYEFFLKPFSKTMVSSTSGFLIWTSIRLVLIFVTAVYLYIATKRDSEYFDGEPFSFDMAWIGLFIVGGFLLPVGIIGLHSWIEISQEYAFINHVYCELLSPGMFYEDVNSALLEIDQYTQMTFDKPDNAPSNVSYYAVIWWASVETIQKDNLWIGLGYDKSDQLVWIAEYDVPVPNPVSCPLYPDSWIYQSIKEMK